MDAQVNYFPFGIELGLPAKELKVIEADFGRNVGQCMREVLLTWLRCHYNVDKFGLPSWQRLAEAVGSPTGARNLTLAKSICSHHPKGMQECSSAKP